MTASLSLFFKLSRATTKRHNKFHLFLLTQRACRDFALCNSVHDENMCSRMVPFVIRLPPQWESHEPFSCHSSECHIFLLILHIGVHGGVS